MTRRWHYLKQNHRSETIHQCVWYDCETRTELEPDGMKRHVLVFGWACYRRRSQRGEWERPEWFRFTEGKHLWRWITSKTRSKTTLYVWAHNAPFDGITSLAFSYLRALGWSLASAIVDSPPFVMKYSKLSSKLVLTDTLNIWRMSLEKMGKLVGLQKLSMPSAWTCSQSDDDYCSRDVEIIAKAVCDWADFLQDNDMGKMCLTVASQAMQTFRHRYLHDDILIDNNLEALGISRASYHGGRVECFRMGQLQGPLYLLDINSLYPFCMASFEFPTKLINVFRHPTGAELRHILKRFLCCAHITCRTKVPVIPIKRQGKLIFPTGTFNAYVSTPELEYIAEHEELLAVHSVAVYEKARPFVQFVQDLYDRRVKASGDGNLIESEHYKLLLNSFSGKWGQNGIKWVDVAKTRKRDIAFWTEIDAQTRVVTNWRRFEGLVQRKDTFPESSNSHPAIGAHITAYGRMVLWAFMRQATPEHYFYCDTDSLLVSVEGRKLLLDSISDQKLGGLKVVREIQECVLYGCKDYVIDGRRTIKGIRDQAVELKPGHFEQDRWIGINGAFRKARLDAARMTTVLKRLRRIYDKGIIRPGGRVLPFHLDEPSTCTGGGVCESGNSESAGR